MKATLKTILAKGGPFIGLILVIVLFLGPGMWSSSTEPIWTTLARAFRDKAPAQESAPEAPDKAPPSEPPASHS